MERKYASIRLYVLPKSTNKILMIFFCSRKRFCLHSLTPPIFWSPDGPVETPPKKKTFQLPLLRISMQMMTSLLSHHSLHIEDMPWYCWWTKSCTTKDDDYPIIYRFLTIPGGAGFRPSTVCLFWLKEIPKKDQPMDKYIVGLGPVCLDSERIRLWKGLLLMGTPGSNDTKTNENMKRPRHEEMKTFIDYNISERYTEEF